MAETVQVLVGTGKGAFILTSDGARADWAVSGPHCDGWPVSHVVGCPRTGRLWAAAGGPWHGVGVWRSDDGGQSWALALLANGQMDAWLARDPEMQKVFGRAPAPRAPFAGEIEAIWCLSLQGDVLYAGAKPAALFASRDGGVSWERVSGLNDHPGAEAWQPGAAGLVLHTILGEPGAPGRLWVGISAAGVFATEDGGATWAARNRRAVAQEVDGVGHLADGGGGLVGACGHDVGYCVHNMVRDSAGMLFQQNHEGVFRSVDGGESWDDIAKGLPSRFGFPIAAHPHRPGVLWVLPLNGDIEGRFPPGGAAAVWRSEDGGETWAAQRAGLPQANCYFTVLRQAMATDRAAQAGVYFGTNTGSVFASRDEGATWDEIARHLPMVMGVEVLHRI